MRLFIAEKPSLGRAIAQCLPGQKREHKGKKGPTHITVGQDVVSWCFGHIYQLAEPEDYESSWSKWSLDTLPMVPLHWQLKPKSEAKEQIRLIKALLCECSEVIHAGDPDREGQLLVDELLEELQNKKPVKRMWLAATDEKSVQKALGALRDNQEFQSLKDSAEARSRGDWLVGMNATRKMTLLGQAAGLDGVLSVGRVQTPTLALVVGRDTEIENFKTKDFYSVRALMGFGNLTFMARWEPVEGTTLDESGRLLDRKVAEALVQKISGQKAIVKEFQAKEKTEQQPLPFSLDRLQMECNRRLGLSAQETLELAQELYESKLISYPRTDCGHLPESQLSEADGILKSLAKLYPKEVAKTDITITSPAWNDQKLTAHHGIIPTGVLAELSGKAEEVFKVIVVRYLSQFYGVYRYLESSMELSCQGEKLVAKGRTPLSLGWRELFSESEDEEGDKDSLEKIQLPQLDKGQVLECQSAMVEAKKTNPPARFTESSLLAAMLNIHKFESDPELKKRLEETAGIGTPATRAGILETLKKRGYIEVKKKQLFSTDKGRQLISVLPLPIKSPGLTALFEQMLEGIAAGVLGKEEFLKKQIEFVTRLIKSELNGNLKAVVKAHSCPVCKKGELRKRPSSKGVFWGCTSYPDCRETFEDQKGRPNLKPKAKPSSSKVEKCQACGKGLVKRSSKNGFFWGCSGFPLCKKLYPDFRGKPAYEKAGL